MDIVYLWKRFMVHKYPLFLMHGRLYTVTTLAFNHCLWECLCDLSRLNGSTASFQTQSIICKKPPGLHITTTYDCYGRSGLAPKLLEMLDAWDQAWYQDCVLVRSFLYILQDMGTFIEILSSAGVCILLFLYTKYRLSVNYTPIVTLLCTRAVVYQDQRRDTTSGRKVENRASRIISISMFFPPSLYLSTPDWMWNYNKAQLQDWKYLQIKRIFVYT